EERAYAKELEGGEKRPEDVRGLLGAGRVLEARYGRVDIQFGEPFDLNQALGGAKPEDGEAFRAAVRRGAHRVVYGIARATARTPGALSASPLLPPGTPAVARADVDRSIALLAERARRAGARLTAPLAKESRDAIERSLDLFCQAGHVEIKDDLVVVPAER